jgi:tripartite-type tricarboxylate transporter receptor subunit TctC
MKHARILGVFALNYFLCVGVLAQSYPAKPVRVIVPFAPGGGSDITARQVSQKLAEQLGQPFVVDNRGGAGGLIGMEVTARSAPDGYTIMIMSGSFSAVPATHKLAFDPINSIQAISEIGYTTFVLSVHPSLPAVSARELFKLAHANPGQLAYATPGVGSLTHLATELMASMAKIKMTSVPYKGLGTAMPELLSGQCQVVVGNLLPLYPHFESRKLRPLAVTSAKRWYALPDVPAMAETLPGYEIDLWFGMMAPKGVPPAAIERLSGAINKVLRESDVRRNLDSQGLIPSGGTPDQFDKRIRSDYERWVEIVKKSDIKIQ